MWSSNGNSNSNSNRPLSPESTSAFPTFLDHDPFPTRGDNGRPLSAASNATSEFNAMSRFSNIPSITGPVGEPGLPPSRPSSNAESSNRTSLPPPPSSRRGIYGKDGSRPGSAVEKTHVPSLTPQRFFRPMSPQALQAQRGQNIQAASSLNSRVGRSSDGAQSRRHRNSDASVNTMREGYLATSGDSDVPPLPSSRGTHTTYPRSQDENYEAHNTTWGGSVGSKNSVSPLYASLHHDTNDMPSGTSNPFPAISPSLNPPRSPLSLRGPFGLSSRQTSKRDIQDRKPSSHGHEKLPSNPESPAIFAKEKQQLSPLEPVRTPRLGKNFEYFDGNVLFLLSGRLINTKARPLNVVTFILVATPAALFAAFSGPWLWLNVSPALPIVFAYFFILTLLSFLNAAFSDPGILPKNLHPHPPNPEEERDPLTVGPATTEWVMVKTFVSHQQTSQQSAAENGTAGEGPTTAMEVPTKYCKSCRIWRPPRAHHCRVCDACVETQDHHCVWLNNCVGRRNYRYFFAFVGYGSLLALIIIGFTLTHIILYAQYNSISFLASITGRYQERIAFAMFIYSVLALPYPASLFLYHLFLGGRGETTREYLNSHKFPLKDRHRPFSQSSLAKNWIAVLFRPRAVSYMDFGKSYVEGDLRFGHILRRRDRKAQAKTEQREADQRQKAMKGQYSVGVPGRKRNAAKDSGVEMKSLPPPPQSARGNTTTTLDNHPPANGSHHPRVDAPLNSTPRL